MKEKLSHKNEINNPIYWFIGRKNKGINTVVDKNNRFHVNFFGPYQRNKRRHNRNRPARESRKPRYG